MHWLQDTWQEHTRNLEGVKIMDELENLLLPEINLETDDIIMNIAVKKDYSQIEDLEERKKEFIKDLKAFIEEFDQTEESLDFMKYYD